MNKRRTERLRYRHPQLGIKTISPTPGATSVTTDAKTILELSDLQRVQQDNTAINMYNNQWLDFTNLYWVLGISGAAFLILILLRRLVSSE